MKTRVYRVTRTGLYVLKVEEGRPPKIGTPLKGDNFYAKILDVIGPVAEPFLVVKPIKGKLEEGESVDLKAVVKRRR